MITTDKIKVCYLLNDFSVGGVSAVVYDTLKGLDLENFEVCIILLSGDKSYLFSRSLDPRIAIYVCPFQFDTDYSLRRYLLLSIKNDIILRRASLALDRIEQFEPDILHLHVLPRELLIGILARKRQPEIKLVYTDHLVRISKEDSTPLKRFLLGKVYMRLYRDFHLIAVSREVLRCQNAYGWTSSCRRNTLIENRISLSEYPLKSYSNNDTVEVVYVARLSSVKGHAFLLDVWRKVKADKIKLRLVGDGEMRAELQEYVRTNSIANVIFEGNSDNVKEILEKASFAVFPSTKEGLPIALLEKMAVGLPVIVNNIPELTDFIEHGTNGLVYSNENELATCIDQLSTNNALRAELGKNARISLENRFRDKTYSEEVCEFYLEVLNE